MLTMASLCSGAGLLDDGVRQVLGDVEHAWFAEVDPSAATVFNAHNPGVPNLGDITAVDWSRQPAVDVLVSGFPCQPSSVAGKRRGSADARNLWPEVARSLDALRPAMFFGENVPGLLTVEKGALFGQLLADLTRLGYSTSWTTVGACRIGLCHHRHRVFIHATLDPQPRPSSAPMAWREGGRWVQHAVALFGADPTVHWPHAGVSVGGGVWAMEADVCGATVPVLPTPTATTYGNNQSPSAGAAVRPSLDSLATLLPTPTARDAVRGKGRDYPEGRPLSEVVALLPTPTASDSNYSCVGHRGAGVGNLRTVAALLPTPTAADGTSGIGHVGDGSPNLRTMVATLLPTPRVSATRTSRGAALAANSRSAPSLEQAVELAAGALPREFAAWDVLPQSWQLLPTPCASDGAKGGPNQRGSSGDLALPAAAQPAVWGRYAAAVARHEAVTGLRAPEPTEPGRTGKPRLSADLPEWMFGLPPGHITNHAGRSDALRIVGNGVVPAQAAHAYRLLLACSASAVAA